MIIIAGHLLVDAAERDRYVETHRDLVRRARAFEGCIEVAVSADSDDPTRINNLEVWADAESLEAWRARADAPELDADLDTRAMKRYDATDGGPLF